MNILMMTNTFSPHVGGVARSIEQFSERYRQLGHRVKVVAPEFDGMPEHESDVVRIPAIRNFNHTDFSVAVPIPNSLSEVFEEFTPDVVHSHHPFLVGGTALRIAHTHQLPLVYTHHTKYEDYTHNVPGDSPALKRFVQNLATNYANACDHVIAPSESMMKTIRARGVTTPVSVVPTGVKLASFAADNGTAMRKEIGIPESAFVVGHLGRLTKEKNIPFLMQCIIEFVKSCPAERQACCLVFGAGPLREEVEKQFASHGLSDRLYLYGVIDKQRVPDAYHAMDVFAFASQSETQGMVLTEAMASGVPVVAVDAPGVREVLKDRQNGRLLQTANEQQFSEALHWVEQLSNAEYAAQVAGARQTAEEFSMRVTADKALAAYTQLKQANAPLNRPPFPVWVDALHIFESEWLMLSNTMKAAADTFTS